METVTCASCGRVVAEDEAGEWMTWHVTVQREGREPMTAPVHRCPACSAGALTKLLQAQERGETVGVEEIFGPPGTVSEGTD